MPVNPVWPKLFGEKYWPEEEGCRRNVPAERAGGIADGFAGGELLDRRAAEHAMVRVDAAVEDHLRECGDIARGGEKSRVAGDAAHGPGVFVVDFALDQALAIGRIVFGGSDARATDFARRIEERIVHPSGAKICLLGEFVERIAGEALDDFAEQDKSEIGVFDLRCRARGRAARPSRARERRRDPSLLDRNRDARAGRNRAAAACAR